MTFAIYDKQLNYIRNEEYETREQAVNEFAEYWKDVSWSDFFEIWDFGESRSEDEDETMAVFDKEFYAWDNEEFLDVVGFEVVEIEKS